MFRRNFGAAEQIRYDTGTQRYDLGLQLQLSPSTLDTIASDHQTADDRKRMMLRKWLQSDPEASWERLVAALTLTGHETTATVIRRQFALISILKDEASTKEEGKIRESVDGLMDMID